MKGPDVFVCKTCGSHTDVYWLEPFQKSPTTGNNIPYTTVMAPDNFYCNSAICAATYGGNIEVDVFESVQPRPTMFLVLAGVAELTDRNTDSRVSQITQAMCATQLSELIEERTGPIHRPGAVPPITSGKEPSIFEGWSRNHKRTCILALGEQGEILTTVASQDRR